MRVSFVRTAGKPDRFYVRRDDGSEVSWSFPTYGDALPHDLVHLVVETAADLRGGFWGRVAAGVDPSRLNAAANRAGGNVREKYAAFGPDLEELLLAEALAATRWDDDWRSALAASASAMGVALPRLSDRDGAAIREVLAALGERWRALGPKGAIDLDFDPRAPRASFDALRR